MMRTRGTVIRFLTLALAFSALGGERTATAERRSGDTTQSAALIGLARTARDQGRFADAARYFRDASVRGTFDTPLLVEYFWVAHRADAQSARQLAERILRTTPGEAAVRDGLIGLLAGARQEAALRAVAQAGHTHDSTAALWPRRIAESYLRDGNGAQAAEYFQRASALAGGTSADLAQRALALERAANRAAALKAWDQVGPSTWSSRPEWMASRERVAAGLRLPPARRPAARLAETITPAVREDVSASSRRALSANPCATAPLEALAALPEPTDFIAAVQTRQATCGNHAGWASLAAERAIGLGRFAEALRVVESVASATDATLAVREQHGVLLHWTGQHARAESVLRTVVAESPGSARAADALIDVLRLTGRADAAWEIAAVEWRPADVALDRQLALAELALETGRVIEAGALARALLDRASGDAVVSHRAYAIAATTLVALGRASEAKDLLHDRAPLESPSTALPWLDAVASTEGVSAALRSADGISAATTAEWADVSARRAVWLAQMGRHRDAERVVTSLEATNATAARLARADVALATGRTADAESLLRPLIESRSQVVRARDGLSTALAEQGRWDEAFVELDELRRARPHEARWAIRSAEWRHRQSPSARTLGALEGVVAGAAGSPDATLALAHAYFRAGRYARVESILSGAAFAASEQALGLRARSLRAAGAPDRALSLLEARTALPVDLLLLKAQLVATLSGLPAADDEFTRLTALAEADPMWYLAWADLHTDGPGQRRVLDLATARFPDAPLLLERLGVVAWAERDDRVAAQAADAALARDRSRQGAWFVKIAAAGAHGSSGAVTRLMNEYATAFAGSPSALLDMGDMLAALARSPGDPAAVAALVWTDAILAAQPNHGGALVTRARLLASLGRLAEAMAILADLTATRPEMPLAHKVQAELFVVHGRFAEAAAAYDRYFALNPGDLAARRLQARIDGWRGATASSLARYSRLRADAPGVPAIEAEAAAKRAYYRGDWRDAIAHYDAWLALEPDDVEARLERAQAYDHQGDTVVARQAYDALASRVPAHRVAVEAASRLERRRAPSVDFFTHGTSADGPSRRQELEIVDAGVGVSDGLGSGYGARARVFGGPSFAATGDRDWSGRHVGAELVTTPRRTLELSAATTYRDWSGADAQWSAESRARVKATQAVAVSAAFGRTLLLENASTLETGLAGVGPSGEISWTPHVDFALDLSAGRLAVNDDNTRDTVRAAVSQRVWRRANEVRLVAASEFLSYAEGRATYFTPSNFWRHDVGAEWRGWLDTPQFFGDKERWLSAAYLFGVDNRHEQYHTARVGAAYEFANGVGAVADALIVRSRVYDGARVTLGLRLKQIPHPGR